MTNPTWQLFRAEWRKTTGNRWLLGCLVGIWPIAALVISVAILALVLLDSRAAAGLRTEPTPWTDVSLFFWAIPNSIIGRLLIVGFAAYLFAGEYQWGTWKNLVTRRGRVTLILMKFLTLGIFMVAAFLGTSLIWMIGRGIAQGIVGGSYPPALTEIPPSYWRQISLQILTAFLSTLTLAGVAALAALLTRSILASVLAGLGAALLDGFLGAALILLYIVTDQRFFPSLYRFSMSYNVDNLLNWANEGEATFVLGNVTVRENAVFDAIVVDPPLPGNGLLLSLGIMAVWAGLFVGLSVLAFYHQDITT
ncbi:MAG: ABC transporter permease subunit [Anaerolineae bacterium]|nr:ABC transporter permease subunit [Anaerolineae bacterium]